MYKNTSSLPSTCPQNILKRSDNMAIKYNCKIAFMQELGHVMTSMYGFKY